MAPRVGRRQGADCPLTQQTVRPWVDLRVHSDAISRCCRETATRWTHNFRQMVAEISSKSVRVVDVALTSIDPGPTRDPGNDTDLPDRRMQPRRRRAARLMQGCNLEGGSLNESRLPGGSLEGGKLQGGSRSFEEGRLKGASVGERREWESHVIKPSLFEIEHSFFTGELRALGGISTLHLPVNIISHPGRLGPPVFRRAWKLVYVVYHYTPTLD